MAFVFIALAPEFLFAQVLNSGIPFFEEQLRRLDLSGSLEKDLSFLRRPIDFRQIDLLREDSSSRVVSFFSKTEEKKQFLFSPIQVSYRFNPTNANTFGDKLMVPVAGHQTYLSAGFFTKLGILNLQFQPEFVVAENRAYQGFSQQFNDAITFTRFIYWNNGDFPERFGNQVYTKFWWGQSKIALTGKHLELYAGTQNIAWGPGQFNGLIFSNNAPGFPHISLNTVNPLKTFIGSFEAQIISGKLFNSFFLPSQNQQQNEDFYIPVESDWRYLNGFTVSYQPKWLRGIYFGLNRTIQINNTLLGNSIKDYFPIFEVFQKEGFFQNGNSLIYDQNGHDQQVSVFSRIVSRKAQAEIYFEFGRRDHAFNWREFILNPDHARAYLLGFQKLVRLDEESKFLQFRGELVHQQESVNRYIRYIGLGGNLTWHTHGTARGFTNFGQALGVGAGVGSNSQIFEVSIVDKKAKRGIILSRLENHQDFFYRAFGQNPEKRPWIDYSLGLIWDQQFDLFTIGSKLQFVKSQNYQWESGAFTSEDFDNGPRSVALYGQVHLIYNFQNK